jgi:hypothetical protein
VVGDAYQLFVRLPPDYETQPGRRSRGHTGFASNLEASGAIPATIVVGLGYGGEASHPYTGRGRDYTLPLQHPDVHGRNTGEAPAFCEFLRTELWPHLERPYSVAGPEGRALFGHSLGGLFATWAFTRHEPAAPLFTAYVAASPSLHFDQGPGRHLAHLEALAARAPPMPGAEFLRESQHGRRDFAMHEAGDCARRPCSLP